MTLALPARCYSAPDTVHCADWRALVRALPARSVDLCLTDTPYGTTACAWDSVIDLAAWWVEMRRVMKPRGAVVMTASQPYTSALVMSNPAWFRYEWVWEKTMATGYPSASRQPLRAHENVLVFCQASATNGFHKTAGLYFPQFSSGKPYVKRGKSGVAVFRGKESLSKDMVRGSIDGRRFPRSVLKIANPNAGSVHPTQKPVALFEYLIRTYTEPGALVLDPFVGSGTTALAARNTGRHYIVGDLSAEYVAIARRRLAQPYTLPMFETLGAGEAVSAPAGEGD